MIIWYWLVLLPIKKLIKYFVKGIRKGSYEAKEMGF